MPKEKATHSQKLLTFVKELGNGVLSTDGSVLHCNACDKNVISDRRFQVEQHLQTGKHIQQVQKNSKQQQPLISLALSATSTQLDKQGKFNAALTEAFLSADIPLWKLTNPVLRQFLSTHTEQNIPNESTLRKNYVPPLYMQSLQRVRNVIGENNIYLIVDETTDSLNRHMCNVLVGPLTCDCFVKPFLLDCVVLESTNSATISQAIHGALLILWPNQIFYDRMRLLLTDAAAYMKKAASGLTTLFPQMLHHTCAAHGIQRVAEVVRASYPDVNDLISSVKQIFVKAPFRRKAFIQSTSTSLPPSPVITRWGTWIEAACYYAEHFEAVKTFVTALDEDTVAIQLAKKTLLLPSLPANLVVIRTQFKPVAHAINRLEEQGLRLSDAVHIVTSLQQALDAGGPVTMLAASKMKDVFNKNPGWSCLLSLAQVLSGTSTSIPCNMSSSDAMCFNYAPITSVDVERSFSEYKNFF